MANKYDDADGVWRTIGGRRVFIRTGQSLSDAMIESGKFSRVKKNEELYKKLDEEKPTQEQKKEETWEEKVKRLEEENAKNKGYKLEKIDEKKIVADWENGAATTEETLAAFGGDEEKMKQAFEKLGYTAPTKENIDATNLKMAREQEIREKQDAVNKSFEENQKKLLEENNIKDDNYYDNLEQYEVYEQAEKLANETNDYELRSEINKKLDSIDRANRKGVGYGQKPTNELREILKENQGGTTSNWKEQIEANNAQLEKDLKAYQDTHDMARDNEGYYELFRENERRNAAIKQEAPNEPYEFVEAYAGYRDKRDKLEGIERDANGNVDWDKVKDATWSGKEYTNDEFLENLEDENWHTERKMLLDAGLTNKQMEFVKDHTTFHNGSPSLDKEITEELIKGAKGEKYRTPKEILDTRKTNEIDRLQKELDNASINGTTGTTSNYGSLKERYKQLSGKDYDDSNVKIPYDPKKTYTYPNGVKIDQKLMRERYSGYTPDQLKREIDHNRDYLMNYSPKDREMYNAQIKEMEKYYNSMEKYESRISDDFSTSEWKEGYGQGAWKGSKSNSGLSGKDKIKAIDDEIRKAYPELQTSRKTGRGGYTDSFSYNVMESDKPLIRSIDDFSDSEINKLYNSGYNQNYYKTKDDFKDHLRKELEKGYMDVNQYNIDDDYRLTPYGKQVMKDIVKVSDAYNFDESDGQTDYFHTGHYFDLGIGKYDKPYTIRATKATNSKMNDMIRASKGNDLGNQIKASIQGAGLGKATQELKDRKITTSQLNDYKKEYDNVQKQIDKNWDIIREEASKGKNQNVERLEKARKEFDDLGARKNELGSIINLHTIDDNADMNDKIRKSAKKKK